MMKNLLPDQSSDKSFSSSQSSYPEKSKYSKSSDSEHEIRKKKKKKSDENTHKHRHRNIHRERHYSTRRSRSDRSLDSKSRKSYKHSHKKLSQKYEKRRHGKNTSSSDESSSRSETNSSDDEILRKKHKKEKEKKEKKKDKNKKNKKNKNKDNDQKTITVKDLKKERENLMKRHFNYTDECNPFGDDTLSTPFVWKLKNKYEKIKHGNKIKVTTNSLLQNSLSKISEIEQVKKRREERDKERAMFEDYKLQLEKQRNQINIKEYIEQEELFFINQQIQSSNDRISHNHIQIVDIFRIATKLESGESVRNIHLENYLTPFYYMLEDLNEHDLENCTKQIKLLISHDRIFNEKKYHKYWNSLYFFCEYYLSKLNGDEEYSKTKEIDEKTNKKIEEFFKNKDYDELITYENKIKNKIITNDTENFDSFFWNNILLKIPFFKAKYILDDFRSKLLKKINITNEHFEKKKTSQNMRTNQEKKEIDDSEKIIFECKNIELLPLEMFEDDKDVHVYLPHEELEERKEINENIFLKLQKNIIDTNIEEESEDNYIKYGNIIKSDILKKDNKIDDNHFNMINKLFTKEKQVYDNFVQKERQKGNKDGIILKDVTYKSSNNINNTITTLIKNNLMISRKPLYFNRIKTSFDWNKYNKTHYDYENTPPKYICGYKFNIFYTNLLNSKQKPSWKIYPCDEEGTVLIVFHGGPPYIDIAFKIINSEWCYDKHRGFRNVFSRGILQLYFNFKKKRYRR
ncbi:cactin homolog, putative [Plasmodium berghei]|uniref:Splicing factor Cactin n=2 Tax=Plasmodium berghei TaxID=5821 RepID=A0A509ANE5_PLABA|nr:cactin homolog, putative [Plasmodium berghei ANKA]CXI78923.1 cactin homolog, putative [Plasmodium berghei]SCN27308.1 cactin homolog, putative [Plasmodium berghei]SCO61927.1 cactin homolog, putative [Plasmodium berghei]SCO63732.1 cactin homolog, putative [Plasmodium berghei]VUC57163.1 cactin homolog, putative [Plasmodium berghei ANKA]|eukprot:XP_034422942.1 cactin homolog, putative [Plasmodium berghei ANKA]